MKLIKPHGTKWKQHPPAVSPLQTESINHTWSICSPKIVHTAHHNFAKREVSVYWWHKRVPHLFPNLRIKIETHAVGKFNHSTKTKVTLQVHEWKLSIQTMKWAGTRSGVIIATSHNMTIVIEYTQLQTILSNHLFLSVEWSGTIQQTNTNVAVLSERAIWPSSPISVPMS
jgi:hypothetical protein